jgi:hypothetical protein
VYATKFFSLFVTLLIVGDLLGYDGGLLCNAPLPQKKGCTKEDYEDA